jgi:murein DD-endopeptidase MepM/ murein hydrolase activator NlpD
MSKLELFYPVKPLITTQAFGIFNPAYKQFDFSYHNGWDYATTHGQIAYAMCDGIVTDVGENGGAGKYVRYKTAEAVEAEGALEVVEFMYMHAEKQLVKKGQYVKAGDPLIVCDNTGFSTGPHLHISAYFINPAGKKIRGRFAKTDYCIDFSKYYNRYFAVDAQKIFSIYYFSLFIIKYSRLCVRA